MDINELLQGVDCACGKRHTCPIKYVYIEKGAAMRLKDICSAFSHVCIVADENTFGAAGESVIGALCDKRITRVIFSGKEILVPNEDAIARVEAEIEGVDVIVGIGSGVIQDLCKYVSHFNKIPYVIMGTAPSMDGYASNGAAMITGGMKVTYPAGLPLAILADTEVIRNAPMEMIKAGYGDVLGKFSALNDWKLSHLVNGEYFCEYIYDLTFEQIKNTLSLSEGILLRSEESVKALMEALVIIGILMSFAGTSRPASGSEHHLSHFFEITGILDNAPYFPHGIDVAYSTIITALIRERIVKSEFPDKIYREEPSEYKSKMDAIYKSAAAGCIALQEKIGNYTLDRGYKEKEEEIKRILAEMPSAAEIEAMLKKAELDKTEFFELYGKEKIENAIRYAKDLKDRYTVLWVYYDLFGGEKSVL